MMNSKRLYVYTLICRILPASRCLRLKVSMLRWCGAQVGTDVEIMSSAQFMGNMNLIIGDHVFIGHDALIFGSDGSTIIIDSHAKVSSRVTLVTGYHEITPDGPCIEGHGLSADIHICEGASILAGSMVLPGRTVNRMAQVAAGSVVTHDVPEYTRVAGVPARVIKEFRQKFIR